MTFADGRLGRRYHASVQSCGHPLAARMVETGPDGRLRTTCWACRIEQPDTRRKNERER